MGSPFATDLSLIPLALKNAATVNVSPLREFAAKSVGGLIHVIGIGGSFTTARLAAILLQNKGLNAIAQTASEFAQACHSPRSSSVLIFTASGNNNDVLTAFNVAALAEFRAVLVVCASFGSAIAEAAKRYWHTEVLEFDPVGRKDGFLATNSLIGTAAVLVRAFGSDDQITWPAQECLHQAAAAAERLAADGRTELIILGSGFGFPAAVDLESKCSEAALVTTMLCDYRHFAHGRHVWLAKRSKSSAVIAIITPCDELVARKTLALIPKSIPLVELTTMESTGRGTIDLLIQVFHFIEGLGRSKGRDPGRPGVPKFGRLLYHLKTTKLARTDRTKDQIMSTACRRKEAVGGSSDWRTHYAKFLSAVEAETFSSLVFDFDGTLCGSRDRAHGITKPLLEPLKQLIQAGVTIAVATGRGDSCRSALRELSPRKYWKQIRVGYHNGSYVTTLADEEVPSSQPVESLHQLLEHLDSRGCSEDCELKVNRCQLTVKPRGIGASLVVDRIIQDTITRYRLPLRLVHSSHSFDVLADEASKLNVVTNCASTGPSLCFGDRGCWPGNDFELLSTRFSLSVDDVSPDPHTCWNLSPAGVRCEQATLFYLLGLKVIGTGVRFSLAQSIASLKKLGL